MIDSDSTIDTPATAPADDSVAAPIRLSIRHVMIWTACCAIGLAAQQASLRLHPLNDEMQAILAVGVIITGLWAGTALMAGIVFIEVWRTRKAFLATPGSWLLVANAMTVCTWLAVLLLSFLFDDVRFVYTIGNGILAVTMSIGFYRYRFQRGWNSVLILAAFRYGLLFVDDIPSISDGTALRFSMVFCVLLETRLFFLAIREVVSRVPRNWIHWLGVAIELTSIPTLAVNSPSFYSLLIELTQWRR